MEGGFLLEDHKRLVEEHIEAINERFHQLQQSALDLAFPSNASGMNVMYILSVSLWMVPISSSFGIVGWLLEEADKTMISNTFLAARMLTEAKDRASKISQMEVSCDRAW